MNRRLLSELRLVRLPFVLTCVLTLLLAGVVLTQAAFLSNIITRVFLLKVALGDVLPSLAFLAGVVGMRALLVYVERRNTANMAIRVKANLRDRFMSHLMRLGPVYIWGRRTGELTMTATEGIEALDAYFRGFLPGLIGAIVIPTVIAIVVLPIDGLSFLVMLLTAPLIPLFMMLIGATAGGLAHRQFTQMRRMGAHFLDVMQGLVTLKLFNRSQAQVESIAHITDQFRQATMRILRVSFLSAFMLEMLSTLSIAIVAVEIGIRLLYRGIGFEQALFLLIIAPEFYLPLRALGARFHAGATSLATAREIYRVLDAPIQRTLIPSAPIPEHLNIRFEHVTFTYDQRSHPALNDITLDIPFGHKVALVGASGSGKTTLANLLLGFITPTTGRITVNGVDLTSLDINQWRERLAWLPQKPYLFNTTIAENIRIAKTGASQAQIVLATQAAGAHDFVSQLPQGYDSPCGEHGMRLSGGQVQRIAIARAILKDAPLLILDEATANLDVENEAIVQTALSNLLRAPDRTALVIAHRLNTVIDADSIYVIMDGQVVERGTHDEVMAHNAAYRELVRAFGEDTLDA